MPCTAARPSLNMQAKRVTPPEKDRLHSGPQHWADIKRLPPGAPKGQLGVLDTHRMCMFGCLACSSVAPPGARDQDVILLGRNQLANWAFYDA
jgi:hypothetical protein